MASLLLYIVHGYRDVLDTSAKHVRMRNLLTFGQASETNTPYNFAEIRCWCRHSECSSLGQEYRAFSLRTRDLTGSWELWESPSDKE